MKNRIVHLGIAVTLAWLLPAALPAEQLKQGTWSGTWVRSRGGGNRRVRSISIEVKNTPDPHWRWPTGRGELLSATLAGIGGQQRFALSDIRLEKGVLSYSFQREDSRVNCHLNLGEDGAYKGDCTRGDGRRNHVTLTPPEPSPEQ